MTAACVSPLVRGYLCGLASLRVVVRLRDGRRATLVGVAPCCVTAKVIIGTRHERVPVADLMYVIDPTDPEEA